MPCCSHHYHVPVHTIVLLLRPEAAHANMNGVIDYAPRPERGSMNFAYEVVRLWERHAEELLAADRVAERVTAEAPPERAKKLLTDAYLLTGLRIRRDAATRIFRGVRVMHESDTYLAILDEGHEKRAKKDILLVGEERLGPSDESVKA